MNKKTRIAALPDFDLAQQLKTEEDIADYVTMVIEEGDVSELAYAPGIAAKPIWLPLPRASSTTQTIPFAFAILRTRFMN